MSEKFLPKHRSKIGAMDALLRRAQTTQREHVAAVRKIYPTIGDLRVRFYADYITNLAQSWTEQRAALLATKDLPEAEGIRTISNFQGLVEMMLYTMQLESIAAMVNQVNKRSALSSTIAGDFFGDDEIGDDEIGDDDPLEIQTGLWHGQAVAYCPRTGHMAIEPLRTQAAKLAQAGLLPEGISGDLIDGLESLHIGDDVILELADDVIGDDVIEIGRGKIRKKIKKGIKKAAKKTVKAAKKVAKSKLGKILKTAVSMANPMAAVSIKALSKGASVVKKAKKSKAAKKAKKAPPKGTAKASKTLAIAQAKNKGRVGPKKAAKIAKKNKIPKSDVRDTAKALDVVDAAQAGDPVAQSAMATHTQIETATETPLDPRQFVDESDGGGGAPSDFGEQDDGSAPELESQEPYFDEGEPEEAPEEEEAEEDFGEEESEAEDEEAAEEEE